MARQLESVKVDVSVVLGRSTLPMQQLLRMGRGAVIALDVRETDQVWVLVNNHPVARGDIVIRNERVTIEISGPADVHAFAAT